MGVPSAAPPPGFGLPQRGVRLPRGLGGAAALRSDGGAVRGPGLRASGSGSGHGAPRGCQAAGEACGPTGTGSGCRGCGAGVDARPGLPSGCATAA